MNQSPPLAWTGVPDGTLSFAVSLYDRTEMNTHWIMWDIPATERMLPGMLAGGTMPAFPPGSSQKAAFAGTNNGYRGPGAAGVNTYEIELWALRVAKLPAATAGQPLNTIIGTVLPANRIASVKITAKGTMGGL